MREGWTKSWFEAGIVLCSVLTLIPASATRPSPFQSCLKTYQGKAASSQTEHSNWSQKPEVRQWIVPYQDLMFRQGRRPLLTVSSESLISRIPELGRILDDLNYYWINPGLLKSRWKTPPNDEEYFLFYQNRLQLFYSGLKQIVAILQSTRPDLASQLEHRLLKGVENSIQGLHRVYEKERHFLRPWVEALSVNHQSRLAELYVLLSVKSPLSFAPTLGQQPEVVQRLSETIQALKQTLKNNPDHVLVLNREFPNIFTKKLLDQYFVSGVNQGLDEILIEVERWILSKEIDVIAEDGSRKVWIEVKRNRDQMTLAILLKGLGHKKGSKTYFQQFSEHEQIVRFLGWRGQVLLRLVATGGVSAHVIKEIKKVDYELLIINNNQHSTSLSD
jgi:hypothetical protein